MLTGAVEITTVQSFDLEKKIEFLANKVRQTSFLYIDIVLPNLMCIDDLITARSHVLQNGLNSTLPTALAIKFEQQENLEIMAGMIKSLSCDHNVF